MKKCLHCEAECEDVVTICPKCGAMVDTYTSHKEYMDVYHVNHGKRLKNKKLILWFLLGLILPYIGFVVSWIMYDGEREKAKALIIGAIVSTAVSTFLPYILIAFFGEEDSNGDKNKESGQKMKILIDIYKSL